MIAVPDQFSGLSQKSNQKMPTTQGSSKNLHAGVKAVNLDEKILRQNLSVPTLNPLNNSNRGLDKGLVDLDA